LELSWEKSGIAKSTAIIASWLIYLIGILLYARIGGTELFVSWPRIVEKLPVPYMPPDYHRHKNITNNSPQFVFRCGGCWWHEKIS